MLLNPHDLEQFFRLHRTLLFFMTQRVVAIPGPFATPEHFAASSPDLRLKARDAFVANAHLIDSFVAENPNHLPEHELDIVRSWRHLVAGKFYIFRELANHTVFLSAEKEAIAYGVLALSQPFDELADRVQEGLDPV
jgi:hypothetical protein